MNRYQKWIDFALLLACAGLAYLLSQMLGQIWDLFRLPLVESLPIPLPTLISVVVGILAFVLVRTNAKAMEFFNEVATELSKVSWPTTQETIQSTGVIIVMVSIASIIMLLYNTFWGTITSSLLSL